MKSILYVPLMYQGKEVMAPVWRLVYAHDGSVTITQFLYRYGTIHIEWQQ